MPRANLRSRYRMTNDGQKQTNAEVLKLRKRSASGNRWHVFDGQSIEAHSMHATN